MRAMSATTPSADEPSADQGEPAPSLATALFRNPHLLWLSVALILVAGLSALISLPRQEDPRIVNRNPVVLTFLPGASAERVETLVTEKIEKTLEEIPAIKKFSSFSSAGVSNLTIELKDDVTEKDNDAIFAEIRDRLGEAEGELPAAASKPFFDDKRVASAYTLTTAIVWTRPTEPQLAIMNRLAEELAERVRGVGGTEVVRLYGEPAEEIAVLIDADAVAAVGLTPGAVAQAIRAADSKVSAGRVRTDDRDLVVEVAGELQTVSRIESVPLQRSPDGSVVRVGDVAEVRRQPREPPDTIALIGDRRAVLVAARMSPGQRIDTWTDAAQEAVDRFRDEAGGGVGVEVIFSENTFTQERLVSLVGNLLAGAAVVMVVVFFTMGWRPSLLIGSALPLTIALVLFALQVIGAELHQMSIFGMIIALGLLIDNAIVVVDETRKELSRGKSRRVAVRDAVTHLFAPLAASTLTTVLAFAPIVLLPGGAGDFVGLIGGSVILAIVASFAVSMTIIATLTGQYAHVASEKSPGREPFWRGGLTLPWLAGGWRRFLGWGLRHPILAILIACSPALIGFAIAPQLGRQFFPPGDRSMFHVRIWLPQGTAVAETRKRIEAVDDLLDADPRVDHVDWLVGGSFPPVYYNLLEDKDGASHFAQGIVWCQDGLDVGPLLGEFQSALDERFPAMQAICKKFDQGPPVAADLQIRIFGPDIETLQRLGEEVRLRMREHPEVILTQAAMPPGEPKLWLDADEDEARLAGFTLGDLAGRLQSQLDGQLGGSVIEQLEEMPVRVRLDELARTSQQTVASLPLAADRTTNAELEWIPIDAIGELTLRPEAGAVAHYLGRRCNTIDGYVRTGALPLDVTAEVMDALDRTGFTLPPGYSLGLGGAVEQDGEATGNLLTYLPILVTLMIAAVILSFRSVRLAMLLGVVAIMAVGLALLSTFCYGLPVSFNTILGTLGLIGVALNDSIVVLAAIRANPTAAAGDRDAIVAEALGCGRHVVSTTLTTIGGFLPLLLFSTGDFWPSLSIVLAGGVGGATLLAMLYVPAAYALLHRKPAADAPVVPAA